MGLPDASTAIAYVGTWVVANGTSLFSVYRWLTAPIEAKILALDKKLEEKVAALDKRVEKVDGYVNPRASMVEHLPTIGELVRRLQELEQWRRETEEFRASVVTDEEFRSYTTLASGKLEKLVETLGWIKGRLGGKVE
jgi:hypothetical protein